MSNSKKQPASSKPKQDIKVKESPHAAALKKVPDEVLARAIHEALLKKK